MTFRNRHTECVTRWLERRAKGLPPARLLSLFEAANRALWERAKNTLGEVTLTAIAERVLFISREKHPTFSSLTIDPVGGIQCRALRERADTLDVVVLKAGIRFVLVELLSVIGNLTAQILTSELHAALEGVSPPKVAIVSAASAPVSAGKQRGRAGKR